MCLDWFSEFSSDLVVIVFSGLMLSVCGGLGLMYDLFFVIAWFVWIWLVGVFDMWDCGMLVTSWCNALI